MKKLIMLSLIIFLFSWADRIKIASDCNVRSSSDINTSEVKGQALKGNVYEILDTFGDYYEIKVVEGESKKYTSDHVGKDGFMWSKRIDPDKEMITIEGCTLRSSPDKPRDKTPENSGDDSNFVAKVKKNAKIKIIRLMITFYKIQGTSEDNFKHGWVYAGLVKKINK